MVAHQQSGSWSNLNLEMLDFEEGGKQEKPLGAKQRTNNRLNPIWRKNTHVILTHAHIQMIQKKKG